MAVDLTISQEVDAETIEMPRGAAASSVAQPATAPVPAARPVGIVIGSGPHLSCQTDELRQARLRAAAVAFAVAMGLIAVRDVLLGWPLWPLAAGLALVMAALAVLLAKPWAWRLCAVEIGMFGLIALGLAAQQYWSISASAQVGDKVGLFGSVKNTIISTIILAFAYCMLIPNTGMAALRVVAILWVPPIVTEIVLFAFHPEVADMAQEVATAERMSENALLAVLGTAFAVYGAHVVHGLRREAFEARQLNQYHLWRKLGSGGMGEVFLAEHQMLKRPCAIKLIRPDAAGDPSALARFEREVQATAALTHPNTIEIYDYGRAENGAFYYVMEYLKGLSLDALVARHGPLPPGRVVYLLTQACEALSEAHHAGLVHRDIKPANLFAAERGGRYDVLKLLDFGLVKAVAEVNAPVGLTAEGRVRGTPLFMAPEQVTGDAPIDHRCDLYALGCVAYFLLIGQPPFPNESAMRVLIAHARDPVPSPARLRPDVPADLEAVVLRCLAKSPDDRYPDALALGRALAACSCASEWSADRAARWWRTASAAGTSPAAATP